MVGITTTKVLVDLTPALTLRDLDRCRVMVWCNDCRRGSELSVTGLISKYGIDTRVSALVPRLWCRVCAWRTPTTVEIERQTGIHRPSGNEPHYF